MVELGSELTGMASGGTTRLSVRIFRGVLWSYSSLLGVRLLVLVWTAVLAHLLSPRDFGLVALALIFTTVLDAMRDLGVNDALVVAEDRDIPERANAAFSLAVLLGVALAAAVAAVSPAAASFFHQPRLLWLLVLLGLNLPLRAAGDTHYALAQRRLDFRSRTTAEVGEVIVRGVTGISLAISGFGPWSLVLGYLAGTLTSTVVLWSLVSWRPALRLHRSELPPLVRFGGTLTIVGIIGTAMSYVDNLFVGRVLGAAALGKYTVGFRLPEMLIVDVITAGGLVLFPGFALLGGPALRRGVIAATRYAFLIALPIGAAMIVLADPIVLALFGRRWHGAAPVIQILAAGFLGAPLALVTGSAYMATKRVDVMLKLAVPQGLLLVVLLVAFVHDGIAAVAACQAATRAVFVPIGVYVSVRVLGIRARELWHAAWPAVVATVGMTAVIVPVAYAISSPWPALIISGALGGAVYMGLARLLAGDALATIWNLVRGGRNGADGSTDSFGHARLDPVEGA